MFHTSRSYRDPKNNVCQEQRGAKRAEPSFLPSAGFSLVEMMLVLLFMALLIAISLPLISRPTASYKLQATARELESRLHEARFTAIFNNKPVSVIFSSDNAWYFIDKNGNGLSDPGEPAYLAPAGGIVLNASTPSSSLSSSVFVANSSTVAMTNRGISFSPRGFVTNVDSSQRPALSQKLSAVTVIYFGSNTGQYTAVSITPPGNVKSWILNGTIWREL